MRLFIFLMILAIAVGAFLFLQGNSPKKASEMVSPPTEIEEIQKENVDFIAKFEIYTNGTRRTFSQSMYHNQSEDAFIEGTSPNTIHIKKEGVSWDDFFKTLPFKLTKDCLTTGTGQTFCTNSSGTLRFVINGTETPDALDLEIKPQDTLEIRYE